MKTRFGMLASCLTLAALVAADAQIEVPPAPTPAPAPAATPAAGPAARRSVLDESQPSAVTAPGPDAQFDAAGLPLEPQSTGPEVQPLVQPESGEAVIAEEATAEAPLRRRWRIAPVFSAGVVYDDNIFLSNVDRVADIIWNFSVGFAFELGDFRGGAVSLGERRGGTENYLIAGWIGVPVFYTNNSAQNAFNQYAYLGLQYRWTKLVAIFDSSFSIVKGASREISQIVTTTTFANSLRFNYDYSEKTLIKLDFRQWASFTDDFQDNNTYEIRAGMTYQIMPKTKIGPEFAVGTSAATDSPFSYYEQVLGTTTWTPTQKFTFRFAGGLEIRQVEGGDPPVRFGPIFSLGMEYHPFDGTSVSLSAYSNISASSAIANEQFTATGFSLGFEQRLFQKFIVAVSFGYENDQYSGIEVEDSTDRVDNYVYFRPRISYTFIQWLSASIFYEYRRTNSSQVDRSFYDNRLGMEFATRF